ncbi:hypothetical protein PhCBS80983_g02388 [Powellomyces hirtus]|uniref:Pyrimidine 5'-nucleotidase n=1 Tax=Powellomyces hirtus TaxID=109895 RepID=A0A507E8P5_9FUNG|nr:HAD-like domain-containing protein [Powellomyces hirtus]TPX59508.1 hypothetical protein PhCBS80983_g02388 [Powellomyces hirtus]
MSSSQPQRVFFFDIDNCLYPKSTGIFKDMGKRIHAYFKRMGFPDEEATELHHRYYTEYGLAIRGLVKHHDVDPLAYDKEVDQGIPLQDYLKKDDDLRAMLSSMKDVRKWAFTNAYKVHGNRVLEALGVADQFEGMSFCDYEVKDFKCKPQEEFYHIVMKAAGVTDPSLCYFVDDSAVNIDMAKKLGWTAVHVVGDDIVEGKHGDFQIHSVKDLPSVLPQFWEKN